nr:PREDICTED: uncharacterized protein C6orf201 homolog [Latimeria chalumnae]|eukprot:XP_014352520.1 PREDICTED: uncharacterized protein C6orf201 homolog [Latimeria chalumnae]
MDPGSGSTCSQKQESKNISKLEMPQIIKHLHVTVPPYLEYSPSQPDLLPSGRPILSQRNEHYWLFRARRDFTPLSTVIVRWQTKGKPILWDQQALIQELSIFGEVESVTLFGRRSAQVVFRDITSACKAVKAYSISTPDTTIYCFWYYNFMMSKYRV